MPVTPTFPGVYIEEIPSGVHAITGVATSITAFVGYTARGLDNRAKRLFSFGDFERAFGGLAADSELSYAVQHYFANGGGEAYVVRVPKANGVAGAITLRDGIAAGAKNALVATALSKGAWANDVAIDVDYDGIPAADTRAFNLTVTDLATGDVESFPGVTTDSTKSRYVVAVVNDPDSGSQKVSVAVPDATAGRPAATGTTGSGDLDTTLVADKTKAYTIKVTSDVPATGTKITNLEFTVLDVGEATPTSVAGFCRLFERKANQALGNQLPGAALRCVPSPGGKGVRVWADFSRERIPGAVDAQLTFAVGTTNNADAALKLVAGTANVGRYLVGAGRAAAAQAGAVLGADGTNLPTTGDLIGSEAAFTGIYALKKVDLFNLLSIPDATRALPGNPKQLDPAVNPNAIFDAAMAFCKQRRAFLLIDPPPAVSDLESAIEWKTSGLTVRDTNGAAYFPRVRVPDPLNGFQLRSFAPSGVVAGLYARVDAARGVWKAPAGSEATLAGVQGLAYKLIDAENGALNQLGLNCFRSFPVFGNVAWGARTLVGADAAASEWKYVPVRRLALYLEESLFRGTKWVIFEPNDEPLWAQIRLNVGAFMNDLFRQGAFQGKTAREAYLVKCDRETTTQSDINRGIVNVLVGFAPLRPAEFLIIRIQQLAGQIQA